MVTGRFACRIRESARKYPDPPISGSTARELLRATVPWMFAVLLSFSGLAQASPAAVVDENPLVASEAAPAPSLDAILDEIRFAESGGQPNGGRGAIGDGGRALGPFQIHRAYFEDSGVPGKFEDCRELEVSRRVVLAYWKRWCPDALERRDAEVLVRVHNGGPRGARKSCTLAYWRKVEKRLAERARSATTVQASAAPRS